MLSKPIEGRDSQLDAGISNNSAPKTLPTSPVDFSAGLFFKERDMSYKIKRSDEEIDAVLNKVADQTDQGGTKYFGMSYEQGVAEGINWITGNQEENPMGDD